MTSEKPSGDRSSFVNASQRMSGSRWSGIAHLFGSHALNPTLFRPSSARRGASPMPPEGNSSSGHLGVQKTTSSGSRRPSSSRALGDNLEELNRNRRFTMMKSASGLGLPADRSVSSSRRNSRRMSLQGDGGGESRRGSGKDEDALRQKLRREIGDNPFPGLGSRRATLRDVGAQVQQALRNDKPGQPGCRSMNHMMSAMQALMKGHTQEDSDSGLSSDSEKSEHAENDNHHTDHATGDEGEPLTADPAAAAAFEPEAQAQPGSERPRSACASKPPGATNPSPAANNGALSMAHAISAVISAEQLHAAATGTARLGHQRDASSGENGSATDMRFLAVRNARVIQQLIQEAGDDAARCHERWLRRKPGRDHNSHRASFGMKPADERIETESKKTAGRLRKRRKSAITLRLKGMPDPKDTNSLALSFAPPTGQHAPSENSNHAAGPQTKRRSSLNVQEEEDTEAHDFCSLLSDKLAPLAESNYEGSPRSGKRGSLDGRRVSIQTSRSRRSSLSQSQHAGSRRSSLSASQHPGGPGKMGMEDMQELLMATFNRCTADNESPRSRARKSSGIGLADFVERARPNVTANDNQIQAGPSPRCSPRSSPRGSLSPRGSIEEGNEEADEDDEWLYPKKRPSLPLPEFRATSSNNALVPSSPFFPAGDSDQECNDGMFKTSGQEGLLRRETGAAAHVGPLMMQMQQQQQSEPKGAGRPTLLGSSVPLACSSPVATEAAPFESSFDNLSRRFSPPRGAAFGHGFGAAAIGAGDGAPNIRHGTLALPTLPQRPPLSNLLSSKIEEGVVLQEGGHHKSFLESEKPTVENNTAVTAMNNELLDPWNNGLGDLPSFAGKRLLNHRDSVQWIHDTGTVRRATNPTSGAAYVQWQSSSIEPSLIEFKIPKLPKPNVTEEVDVPQDIKRKSRYARSGSKTPRRLIGSLDIADLSVQALAAIKRGKLPEIPRLREKFRDRRFILNGNWRNEVVTVKRFHLEVASRLGLAEEDWSWLGSVYEINLADLEHAAERKEELEREAAATRVQRKWRILRIYRKAQRERAARRNALIQIQRWWHIKTAFTRPLRERCLRRPKWLKAIVKIQSCIVGWKARRHMAFLKDVHSIVYRLNCLMEDFGGDDMYRFIRLQAKIRGHLARQKYAKLKEAKKANKEEEDKAGELTPCGRNKFDKRRMSFMHLSGLDARRGTLHGVAAASRLIGRRASEMFGRDSTISFQIENRPRVQMCLPEETAASPRGSSDRSLLEEEASSEEDVEFGENSRSQSISERAVTSTPLALRLKRPLDPGYARMAGLRKGYVSVTETSTTVKKKEATVVDRIVVHSPCEPLTSPRKPRGRVSMESGSTNGGKMSKSSLKQAAPLSGAGSNGNMSKEAKVTHEVAAPPKSMPISKALPSVTGLNRSPKADAGASEAIEGRKSNESPRHKFSLPPVTETDSPKQVQSPKSDVSWNRKTPRGMSP